MLRTASWLIDKDGLDDGTYDTPKRWRCGNDAGQNQRGAWKSWGVCVSAGAVPPSAGSRVQRVLALRLAL